MGYGDVPAGGGQHTDLHRDIASALDDTVTLAARLGTGSIDAVDANDGDVWTADGTGGGTWEAPTGGGGYPEYLPDPGVLPATGEVYYGTGAGTTTWAALSTLLGNAVENAVINAFGNALYSATVTLTSADLLDLHDTPITLVSAPGAGKYLMPHQVSYVTSVGTTAYANGTYTGVLVTYGDGSVTIVENVGNLTSNGYIGIGGPKTLPEFTLSTTSQANVPIKAFVDDAFTLGDFDLTITVWYSIEDVPA